MKFTFRKINKSKEELKEKLVVRMKGIRWSWANFTSEDLNRISLCHPFIHLTRHATKKVLESQSFLLKEKFSYERERERDKWVSEEERTNIVPSLKNVPYDEVTDSLFFDDQEFPLIRWNTPKWKDNFFPSSFLYADRFECTIEIKKEKKKS